MHKMMILSFTFLFKFYWYETLGAFYYNTLICPAIYQKWENNPWKQHYLCNSWSRCGFFEVYNQSIKVLILQRESKQKFLHKVFLIHSQKIVTKIFYGTFSENCTYLGNIGGGQSPEKAFLNIQTLLWPISKLPNSPSRFRTLFTNKI